MQHDRGVFADRVQHHRAGEFRSRLPENADAFGFKRTQVRENLHYGNLRSTTSIVASRKTVPIAGLSHPPPARLAPLPPPTWSFLASPKPYQDFSAPNGALAAAEWSL